MDIKDSVKDADEKVKGFWRSRTTSQKVQLITLVVLTLLTIGATVYFTNKTNYSVLFAGMTQAETSQIYAELKNQGIDVQLRGNDTLLVPEKSEDDLRMSLVSQGLPQTGYAYDVWNTRGTVFGATDSDKKLVWNMQLQENLAQTISKISKVESALVTITMPSDSKFPLSSGPVQKAQATVMLTLKPGAELTRKEAETIRYLVQKGVPSLDPENIALTDTNMNLYSGSDEDNISAASDRLALQSEIQKMMEKQVNDLFSPIYGKDNFTVAANVVLNFDEKQQSSVRYEPPTDADNMGIIISQSTTSEYDGNGAQAAQGNTGLDPNGGIGMYPNGGAGENADGYYRQTNEFNAELNQFKEELKQAKGVIEALSVSIMINGEAGDANQQAMVTAVAKAIGVDEGNISIMFTPFTYANQVRADEAANSQNQPLAPQTNVWLYAFIGIGALLILLALIFIILGSRRKKQQAAVQALAAAASYVPDSSQDINHDELDERLGELENAFGKNSSDVVEQIRKMVEKNPESVAQLLRNWLVEEY